MERANHRIPGFCRFTVNIVGFALVKSTLELFSQSAQVARKISAGNARFRRQFRHVVRQLAFGIAPLGRAAFVVEFPGNIVFAVFVNPGDHQIDFPRGFADALQSFCPLGARAQVRLHFYQHLRQLF